MKAVLRKWWPLITVMAVILAVFIPFMMGYRLAPGLTITQVGTLLLHDLPDGTSVYVDNTLNRQAVGDSYISLIPGSHTLIVSAPGHQPWNEIITIDSGTTTEVRPLFVPLELEGLILPAPERAAAKKLIDAQKLPTSESPLLMEGGCVAVSVVNNRVLAEAASEECQLSYLCADGTCGQTVVFSPVEPLLSVGKLPGREDTLLVSVGQTLFVLELDPRQPQFFAPLLRAPAPRVAPWGERSIVVMTGTQLFELSL